MKNFQIVRNVKNVMLNAKTSLSSMLILVSILIIFSLPLTEAPFMTMLVSMVSSIKLCRSSLTLNKPPLESSSFYQKASILLFNTIQILSIIRTATVININAIVSSRNINAISGMIFVYGTTWVIITRNIISVSKIVARQDTRSPVPLGSRQQREPRKATRTPGMMRPTSIVPPSLYISIQNYLYLLVPIARTSETSYT